MSFAPKHQKSPGRLAQGPAPHKAALKGHHRRHHRGLRHKPHDLVEWICREECSAALGGPLDRETWQDGFCDLCRYVLENRSFFVNVCNSIGREQAENYLYRVTYSILRSAVDELAGDMPIGEEEKKFIADFYKFAFVGVELEWLRSGMREPPEELAGRLSRLLNGHLELALRNLSRE